MRRLQSVDDRLPHAVQQPVPRTQILHDFRMVEEKTIGYLGWWQPEAMERSLPVPAEAWPVNARFALAHHPVPDIA